MAGFVQIWSSQQLEKGAPGCPDYHGTTGPNTHAIVLSNDSENTLLYRSDVDSGLYVPPRTSLTIPCDSNMQYVLTVDASSVPTTTSNQLVILSETNQELAYSSTPLPAPSLVQFIATIFPGNIDLVIPPQFTAIVVVPVDQQTQLTITGIDSTFAYFEAPFTQPITIQMYPGLDPSGLKFLGTGGGTTKVYGLTVPLTELGTASPVLATIVAPVASALQASSVLTSLPIPDTLSLLAGWDESDPTNVLRLRVLRAAADNADAVAAQADSTLKVVARLTAFNGTTWDRVKSNHDSVKVVQTPPAPATFVANQNIVPGTNFFQALTNDSYKGVTVELTINSISGGGSITLNLVEITLEAAADFRTLLTSGAINAVGQHIQLTLYPGIAAVANLLSSMVCPYIWRPEPVLTAGAANVTIYIHYIQ